MSSTERWGNLAVGGAVTAASGGLLLSTQSGNPRKRDLRNLQTSPQGYRQANKDMRSAHYTQAKVEADYERKAASGRQVGHARARTTGAQARMKSAWEKEASMAGRLKSATKVRRVGSGALGTGLGLAALGAVMAERSRKTKRSKPAGRAVKRETVHTLAQKRIKETPLKDYRAMVSQGGLLTQVGDDGRRYPAKVGHKDANAWIKAHGGSK